MGSDILSSALSGINRGMQTLSETAFEIAKMNGDDDRMTQANGENNVNPAPRSAITNNAVNASDETARLAKLLVAEQQAQTQVEANAKVIKTHHETIGTLLDTFA